jgi:UDP-glucose 4-epimerase
MARELLKAGMEVRALDLVKSPVEEAERHIGSILDITNISRAVRGCDYVVHLAAMMGVERTEQNKMECLNVNILGTSSVLDACVKERVKKIVFASSSEVYGDQAKMPITEESPLSPKSVYGVSKVCCEEYLKAYKQTYDLDYSVVRFFNIYGPGQVTEFVIPRFVKAVVENRPPVIYGKGDQVRAFCHVSDAVRGTRLALLSKKANGQAFNIGNDTEPISMKDLALKVIKISRKNMKPAFIPLEKSDRKPEREILTRVPSIEKARKVLGYRPKVGLNEGILSILKDTSAIKSRFEPLIKATS